MNVLIIETAFLGDVIISLGLASELKRLVPASRVTYLVRPDAVEIASACPDVDEAISFDKRGSESGRAGVVSKAKSLNTLDFDTVILLHGSRRSQVLCSYLRVPVKIGFGFMTQASLTITVEDTGWKNRYERAVLPLTALFKDVDITAIPRLDCPRLNSVTEFCQRFSQVVALAPGSAWETKKWGDEKFVQLAVELTDRNIGVIVIGTESDRQSGKRIASLCKPNSILDLTGRTTLLESAGAIASASLLVANDSAPAHLAVAVGTPVISIFGPTVPAFGFAPPPEKGEVIEVTDVWCRPCTSHGSKVCPIYTHDCMESISTLSVMDHVTNALA
jgi:heptosyltransferase-2